MERNQLTDVTERAGVCAGELGRRVEGDCRGQTEDTAARSADFARPGEELVGQELVDALGGAHLAFREIGPVELEGVGRALRLHSASAPA